MDELSMTDLAELSFPIYKLGELSASREVCNRTLMCKTARILLHACGLGGVGVAMFEGPLDGPASASCAAIDTAGEHTGSACVLEQDEWSIATPGLAMTLSSVSKGEFVFRDEVDEKGDVWAAVEDGQLGRTMVGVFGVGGAKQLLIVASGIEDERSETLLRAIVSSVSQCCESDWKKEPAWMADLRPASRQVLELVLRGYDDDQVSELSGLTYHSVRAHLKRLFRAAGVRSRLHLMQVCRSSPTTGVTAGAMAVAV
ncbi:MAG: helix-turn-helix transcriptional regulator [Planctomycetota bacterium]